jgi:hypothetical protein
MLPLLLALATLLGPRPAGTEPTEAARVHAHLVAARAVVRAHDAAQLSPAQRMKRAAALANLDRYIQTGEFPQRTDDAFVGLRPRFIDARGVHCAVGYLIATSGHPELARAINRQFEYAYVREIDSPALLAWADEHGFTVDELARIQPSYSAPPTPSSIEREIEREKDRLALTCADGTAHSTVKLVVKGDSDGNVVTSAADRSDRFATCVAETASQVTRGGGGAYSPSPTAFTKTIEVALSSPNQLLAARMRDQIGVPHDCAPRPGAIPTQATITIGTEAGRIAIEVTTSPANPEINACIAAYLQPRLHDFTFVPDLAWKQPVKLPRMTSQAVHDAVLRRSPTVATDCAVENPAPAQVAITVRAARDDKTFTITTDAKSETFARCLVGALEPKLHASFTVTREREGVAKPYFRIDNAIETMVTIAVETTSARDARLEKARRAEAKRVQELMKELEREKQRRRYDF